MSFTQLPIDNDVARHRSFLSLYLCTKLYNEDQRNRGAKRVVPKSHETDDLYKDHVWSCPIWPSEAPMQRRVFDARLLRGGRYDPVQILARPDQHFTDYATPWESEYSVLADRGFFVPIVDESFTVIGHFGNVRGDNLNLIGPAELGASHLRSGNEIDIDPNQLRKYVAEGVEIFFHQKGQPLPPGTLRVKSGTSEHQFGLVTTLDGQLTDVAVSNAGFLVSVDYSPADLFVVGTFLAALAAGVGKRMVRALVRRAAAKREARAAREALEGAAAAYNRAPKWLGLHSSKQPIRRLKPGALNPKIKGRPDPRMPLKDQEREIHAANRFAQRGDFMDGHMGDEARLFYKAPDGKFPDVVVRLRGTEKEGGPLRFALSEGKGTEIDKMIKQFETAKTKIEAAETARSGSKVAVTISEQEVVIERVTKQPVEGGFLKSPGPGFGVDEQGFLLDARAFVDLKHGPPPRLIVNGSPVRVITMESTPIDIFVKD